MKIHLSIYNKKIDSEKNGNYTIDSPEKSKHIVIEYLDRIETTCISWFTLEFLIRLVTAPNIFKFMRDFLNIIDILCILPFYFGLFLNKYQFFIKIKYILQMLRMMRLLKLGRYSTGIK
jgi:hypothetical protein